MGTERTRGLDCRPRAIDLEDARCELGEEIIRQSDLPQATQFVHFPEHTLHAGRTRVETQIVERQGRGLG